MCQFSSNGNAISSQALIFIYRGHNTRYDLVQNTEFYRKQILLFAGYSLNQTLLMNLNVAEHGRDPNAIDERTPAFIVACMTEKCFNQGCQSSSSDSLKCALVSHYNGSVPFFNCPIYRAWTQVPRAVSSKRGRIMAWKPCLNRRSKGMGKEVEDL